MAQLLKTQSGIGPITSLAFVLTIFDLFLGRLHLRPMTDEWRSLFGPRPCQTQCYLFADGKSPWILDFAEATVSLFAEP